MTADVRDRLQEDLADRYRLERELGRGGMATVFLAQDLKHDREVALKVLRPELAATLGPDRFAREIRTTARLQHPHILPVLDSGESAGQLWYTMPYVSGESLRDRLRREGQLPVEVAIDLARQVALALDYAHRQGIVHRDLKPENILLSDGQALVADFGIAKALHAAEEGQLTETGLVVGTIQYMAPEQASGGNVDGRTDEYALACVLYESLSGEPPYTGATPQSITVKRLTDPVPSVRRLRSTVSTALDDAVKRALAPVPADRFASASEFARALTTPDSAARPATDLPVVTRASHSGRSRTLLAALLLCVILSGFLLGWWRSSRGATAPVTGPKMLAVLPFENLGRAEDEYFADGLTEEITGRLGSVKTLGVIGRTSTTQYKGSARSLKVIGRELGVEYVLEGSVRWERPSGGASRLRVTPQLIHVADERQLWAERYDADLADVFQVQGNIAEQVTRALTGVLLGADDIRLTAKPTDVPEAYDAYLRANGYLGGAVTESNVRSAVALFERALALDPDFALAYARLSQAHMQLYWFEWDRTPARLAAGRRCADQALRLAPDSPESHMALGNWFGRGPRQVDSAEKEFAAAYALAPSNTEALLALGGTKGTRGKWAEQMELLQRAATLDPRSSHVALILTEAMLLHRRFQEAKAHADRGITITPDNAPLYALKAQAIINQSGDVEGAREVVREGIAASDFDDLVNWLDGPLTFLLLDEAGQAKLERSPPKDMESGFESDYLLRAEWYYFRGRPEPAKAYSDSARAILVRRVQAQPSDPDARAKLGMAYALLGRKDEALLEARRAAQLTGQSAWRGTDFAIDYAKVATLVGEYDLALGLLEKLLAVPSRVSVAGLRADPSWEALRRHPRFEKLIRLGNSPTS